MGLDVVLGIALSLGDILLKKLLKEPNLAPTLAPHAGAIIKMASQAAGETPEETAARMQAHDALVARYAAGPPPTA